MLEGSKFITMINFENDRFDERDVKDNSGNQNYTKKPKLKLSSHSKFCPICGNAEAGSHLHYGGRGCSSCRAFFRRSVQNLSYNVGRSIAFLEITINPQL